MVSPALSYLTVMERPSTSTTSPASVGDEHVGRVAGGASLDAGADERRLGLDQRNGLALHVGAHQGPVGVVVLEERDQRRGDRDDLLGRDVHELDLVGRHRGDLGGGAEEDVLLELEAEAFERGGLRRAAHEDAVVDEPALVVELGVGLGDDVLLLLIGGEVDDLVGDLAVLHHPVRRLDEAERVDPGVRRERTDEADVGTFRRLDGAHAAVVREVDVADFEPGALTGQTARAERRETAPVGEARQGVDLVHELRQLGGSEELLDRGHDGTDVDERLGRDGLDVLGGHALPDDPLHAGETDADLVLDQLADRADATVGEVVLVIQAVAGLGVDQVQQVGTGGEDLGRREHRLIGVGPFELEPEDLLDAVDLGAELAVELVAADPAEVVALRLEERVAEVGAGGFDRRRLTGAGPLVDLDQGLFLGGSVLLLLLPLSLEEAEALHEGLEEPGGVLLVEAEGAQQGEHGHATLAGDAAAGGDVLAGLLLDVELDPLATVGVDGAGDQLVLGQVAQAVPLAGLEDDAGRPHELRHDDALGAVDDEGALAGHHREVAHEDRLLFDLAGLAVHESGPDEDRGRVGHVLLFALLDRELRRRAQILVVGIELHLQLQVAVEVGDRTDVRERIAKTFVQEPLERGGLDGDEIRQLENLGEVSE